MKQLTYNEAVGLKQTSHEGVLVMGRKALEIKFHFHNGGEWTISTKQIGDLWIKRVSQSIGRLNGQGEIVEIRPAEGFKIEIYPDADTFQSTSINQGGLESGMFETVVKNDDIEWMTLVWDDGSKEEIYFPFEPSTPDKIDNVYMTARIGENGHLYIVIHEEETVDNEYFS